MPTAADTEVRLRESLAQLDAALEAHAEAVARAKANVEAVRDVVHERLDDYGAMIHAEETAPDAQLMREIYWEYPQVRADAIATILNLRSGGLVHAAVGPHNFERPCRGGCGRTIARAFTSRADTKNAAQVWRWCSDCQEDRAQEHAIAARQWRARDAESNKTRLEELNAARQAGVQPAAIYVEYPGIPGTWRVHNADIIDGIITPAH